MLVGLDWALAGQHRIGHLVRRGHDPLDQRLMGTRAASIQCCSRSA
jgi:hypothetical protein